MSDFVAFEEDIDSGMEYLEHFGILGQRKGKRNGPPYPLGKGDHSAGEKAAAKAAGVSVGSDSGKGSIENVKKKKSKPKKPLTPEERRAQALEAVSKGDKKKITKNMDQLSTEELRDAEARAKLKDSLSKSDSDKKTKADKEKEEVIKSGDKEKIQAYADKLTYNELTEAINKMNLMSQLNHVDPPPTAFERMQSISQKLGTFKEAAEKTIAAYNTVATVMNSLNKDGDTKWPIIDKENNQVAKTIANDVKKEVKETAKEKAQEKEEETYWNKVAKYNAEQKFEKYKKDSEKKAAKKLKKDLDKQNKDSTDAESAESKPKKQKHFSNLRESLNEKNLKPERAPEISNDHKYIDKEGEGENAKYTYKPETPPNITKATFNTKINSSDIDYDDVIPDSAKKVMNQAHMDRVNAELDFDDLYDYAMRHSEV